MDKNKLRIMYRKTSEITIPLWQGLESLQKIQLLQSQWQSLGCDDFEGDDTVLDFDLENGIPVSADELHKIKTALDQIQTSFMPLVNSIAPEVWALIEKINIRA
ncbi:MAG: hypothetical protein JXM68_07075 [Sedimentisphaerales bacterium]|nr:hypothetical protein [Sedimentisphaerales bacterium]